MQALYPRCCGLDIHQQSVVACVLLTDSYGAVQRFVRTCGNMTADLLALGDWLEFPSVTHVALESAAVLWRPAFNVLEQGHTLLLVNAQPVKAVPGRKTDAKDSEWLADPARAMSCCVPALSRHSPSASCAISPGIAPRSPALGTQQSTRVQQVVQTANLKLGAVASNVVGASGRRMLRAVEAGEGDPAVLADLARGRLREQLPALRLAL